MPYGLLYVASSIMEEGHEAKILNLCLDMMPDEDVIKAIEEYNPQVIGFGAITSGYRNLKRLSKNIKSRFPEVPLVVGGVIASISEMLIAKTAVDIVVLREGEVVIKNILKALSEKTPIADIKGIAYRDKDQDFKRNAEEKQIADMNSIPFPQYSLVDMKRHCRPIDAYLDESNWSGVLTDDEQKKIKSRGKYMITIFSSRGCINKCSFCYRHMTGARQFSARYVIRLIQHIQREYDIHFFQFIDELTNVSRKWVFEFCDLLDSEDMHITYVINGARADNIDEAMLRRLKETGCIKIGFGYESGSQEILDYIGKRVTREQNYKVAGLMKKVGICDAAQIMIGFPPESPKTIRETADFLKSVMPIHPSVNYVLPFPGTRDWEYCLRKGLIKNEEEFILGYDEAYYFRVNLTDYPDSEVAKWRDELSISMRLAGLRMNSNYLNFIAHKLYFDLGLSPVKNRIKGFLKQGAAER